MADGEVHSFKKNFGRLDMVGGASEEQHSGILCQRHTEVDIDNRCIRNRIGGVARIDDDAGGSIASFGGMISDVASEKLQSEGI
ncbi:MAG: hypothetical protein EZS28_052118 [Streblomastix strix]|uniref:Uncharacterized protein n=1 Tax=Streblomastix strix TaxID=222440 RepID=A0A5J4SLI3_9EUKA|nr:MAG: hypothetical protein EZS28_052118 [Streblomastix strix]